MDLQQVIRCVYMSVQIMGADDAVLTDCYHTCPSEVSIAEDERGLNISTVKCLYYLLVERRLSILELVVKYNMNTASQVINY